MDRSIYGFIFRHSRGQQLFLLLVTCMAFPFIYLQPDLVKKIVNRAIGGKVSDFPKDFFGIELEQIAYLVGFQTPEVLRYHFRRTYEISPGEYRKRFSPAAQASL